MPLGLHPAEFVPAAPLLPLLGELLGYAVAFGLCVIAAHFVKALFAPTESFAAHIPWIGRTVSNGVHVIEQKLTHKLEEAVAGLDHRMALAWYKLAHTAEWIGHEIMANSGVLLAIARMLEGLPGLVDWRAFIRKVKASLVWAEHHAIGAVHTVTRGIAGELTHLEKWIGGRVRVIDHTIEVALPRDIAGLRTRAKKLERLYSNLYKRIARTEARFANRAFAGAVAVALGYLGLGWLRCNSLKSLGKRVGCGGWQILDDLLAGVIDVLVIADLCQLTKLLIEVAESAEVQTVISGIIDGMDELMRCQGVERPADLAGYWTAPPPLQTFAELPAV